MFYILNFKDYMGFFYLFFSFFGGLLGFAFSIILRLELNSPILVLGSYFYYVCLTNHGLVMVFYFLTILSSCFYIYSFSEIISLSFYKFSIINISILLISLIFILISLILGEGVNLGWTFYVPLSLRSFNNSFSVDLILIGLNLFLIFSILNSILIISSIIKFFNRFESFLDISVIVWSFLLTSFLNIFSIPSLLSILSLLLLDRNLGTFYFNCEFGGSLILFQSFFWIWGHVEVYVLILPVFGVISQVLFLICGGYIFNKGGIIFSMLSLSILSFLVWGHHMTSVGWNLNIKGFFMLCTLIISIPTGVKVFSWVYTLVLYGKSFNMISGFIVLFIISFSFGGLTGVFLANYSLDLIFHDSYFVIGHFHSVLSSAAIFGFLSGLFIFNKQIFFINLYNLNFLTNIWILFFIIFSLNIFQLIFTFHILGLSGISRRVFSFYMENYLMFHIGSISFLGIWISVFILIYIYLYIINKSKLIKEKNEK